MSLSRLKPPSTHLKDQVKLSSYYKLPPWRSATRTEPEPGSLLINSKKGCTWRKLNLTFKKTFSHMTKPCIMVTSFCIIPMGNHNRFKTRFTRNIGPINPVQRITNLVYFKNRKSRAAEESTAALVSCNKAASPRNHGA